jgi:hypothetical protein
MGEPQLEQKVRSAKSDSFKVVDEDEDEVVNFTAYVGTSMKGR